MSREIFKQVKNRIILSGLNIKKLEYEDATNCWHIELEAIRKITVEWDNATKYFSIKEAKTNSGNGLITWRYIYVSTLTSEQEILTELESILALDN